MRLIQTALTFDDVLLVPAFSQVLPRDTSLVTRLTRNISLNIPLVSAAMDTVTEYRLAIAMAQEGGIGIIHKNLTADEQAREVARVKRHEFGIVTDPITVTPDMTVRDAIALQRQHGISGLPVVQGGKVVGIVTNRDLRFETRMDLPISARMTKENLVTCPQGTTLEQAKELLHRHRIEKLLVVDRNGKLKGLITVKDIQKQIKYPNASKDSLGRLRVGAAVGAGNDLLDRARELIQAKVDVLCLDSSHGHSERVLEALATLKKKFPSTPVMAGNVATKEGTRDLIRRGADAVKIGIGPGSICTTRIVTGVGVPQIHAIREAVVGRGKSKVPLVADGGIKFSGDVTKALASGADAVMIGSLFAGTDEAPGETILYQGRTFKAYRGMGSLGAMKAGSADRYFQDAADEPRKMVPEGIEGMVPYKGTLSTILAQITGGVRSGMGLVGAKTLPELSRKAKFIRITSAGLKESHVHDVMITKEAPNYRREEV